MTVLHTQAADECKASWQLPRIIVGSQLSIS